MRWVRDSFGSLISGAIIGFFALIFVVSGVFSPKATRGLHEGAVAGTVNGEPISIQEFNRAVNQRMEFFKRMGGGKLTEDQLKQFGIRQGAFQELVRYKLMEQEAARQGLEASDEEVRDRIREMKVFQKGGQFDLAAYKNLLVANNFTTTTFERSIRSELSTAAWQSYFQNRVRVSEGEITAQYEMSENKREIRYAVMNLETGKKGIQIAQPEVDKFLADPARMNLAKSQFESRKDRDYKGMTFDMVKGMIAKEILAGEKIDDVRKINEKVADQVLGVLTAEKSSDGKVNAILKPYKTEVKSSGLVSAEAKYLPGVGEAPEILKDAFAGKSPIDPAQGGKAKKYVTPNWAVVAVVAQVKKADPSGLAGKRGEVLRQIAERKQRELFDEWLKKLQAKAKIDTNPAVVGANET